MDVKMASQKWGLVTVWKQRTEKGTCEGHGFRFDLSFLFSGLSSKCLVFYSKRKTGEVGHTQNKDNVATAECRIPLQQVYLPASFVFCRLLSFND